MRWQYKTVVFKMGGVFGGKVPKDGIDRTLAELGQDQWELVSTLAANQGYDVVLLFKRPK